MSLVTTLEAMTAAGCTPEQMLAVVRAHETAEASRSDDRRAKAAERQRRSRLSRNVTVTERDACDATPPKKETSPEPPKEKTTPSPSEPSALRAAVARRNPWPANFGDLIWQRYPKRVDKKAGMAALDAEHRRDRLPWDHLIAGIDRLIANTEPQFVPSLERWLKKERWNDEYGRRPTGPPRQSQPTFADIARDFDHQMQGSPDDPSRDEATTRWDANAPGADGRRDGPPVPQPPRLAGRPSGPDLDLVVAGPYDR